MPASIEYYGNLRFYVKLCAPSEFNHCNCCYGTRSIRTYNNISVKHHFKCNDIGQYNNRIGKHRAHAPTHIRQFERLIHRFVPFSEIYCNSTHPILKRANFNGTQLPRTQFWAVSSGATFWRNCRVGDWPKLLVDIVYSVIVCCGPVCWPCSHQPPRSSITRHWF